VLGITIVSFVRECSCLGAQQKIYNRPCELLGDAIHSVVLLTFEDDQGLIRQGALQSIDGSLEVRGGFAAGKQQCRYAQFAHPFRFKVILSSGTRLSNWNASHEVAGRTSLHRSYLARRDHNDLCRNVTKACSRSPS